MPIDRDGVQLATLFIMGAYDCLRTCKKPHDEVYKIIKKDVAAIIKRLQNYMKLNQYAMHLEDYFSPELAHDDIVDPDPAPVEVQIKPKNERKVVHVTQKRTPNNDTH